MRKKEITQSVATSSCLAGELLYSHCGFMTQKLLLESCDFKMLIYMELIWGKKIIWSYESSSTP